MLPIENYIDAIENKDYEGLGNLFTKDGHYCDYCANGTPQHDYHLYGKEAISMFFRNKFLCRQIFHSGTDGAKPLPGRVHCVFRRLPCDGDRDTAAVICRRTYPAINRTPQIETEELPQSSSPASSPMIRIRSASPGACAPR